MDNFDVDVKAPVAEISDEQLTLFDAVKEEYISSYGDNPVIIESVNWLINELKPNSAILDLGCGTAQLTAPEIVKANHSFTGIDSSEEMLKIAKKITPTAEFLHMDFSALDLDKKYDAVTAYFSLLMLPKNMITVTLKSLADIINKDGYLIISMVQGDFDYIEIPFFSKKARASAYLTEDLKLVVESMGFEVVKIDEYAYTPEDNAPVEVQQFFYFKRK